MKKYVVELSQHERESLRNLVRSGKGPARMFSHARILLKADASEGAPAWPDERISEAFDVWSCPATVDYLSLAITERDSHAKNKTSVSHRVPESDR